MKERTIYALGFFDGVHLGHQALLRECVRLAVERNALAAAITFDRHPQSLFTKDPPPLINTPLDRQALLCSFGIGSVYQFPVNEKVMSTSWQDFLGKLLEFGAAGFVCGEDFRFGHRGEGNAEKLKAFCAERKLPYTIVSEQILDGIRISSTYIRKLLENGEMETAVKFLGHAHCLSGEVIPGRQLGRTIGIPTANIALPEECVVPKLGVYACMAVIDGERYPAVTNIGSRPTVGGHQVRAESWILDFAGDLYGKTITLEFCAFLRPEEKFDSMDALKAQIRADAWKTKTYFQT